MSDQPARPALRWRSSSYSTGMNNCVETAPSGSGRLLAVRDSKDAARAPLEFSATAWTSFVSGLKR
ncbi:DUF397 domain-containing protein [Streptomyces sp. 130]|uniref:DUF397 domain-containing protein n=1 Tax=Streptomyces sp. 130 TaxID=2591006 RepID=UPI00117E4390|nr:DUF397 domain-containing protein [Streptomyces sp. 130]TRV76633.1 DUF397 domain-containing protein [Streptomyces sp. 130]